MTESQWLTCIDPVRMLAAVAPDTTDRSSIASRWLSRLWYGPKRLSYRASERRMWLFNGACGRRLWERLNEDHRAAIKAAELCVDGQERRELAIAAAHAAWTSNDIVSTGFSLSSEMAGYMTRSKYAFCAYRLNDDLKIHAMILRDIFGNPFRPVSVSASWLAWNDATLCKMAQVIYDDRAFDHLPLLADALEEAGCADAAILGHCRDGGEHVRGCWVMDLLLGKQ